MKTSLSLISLAILSSSTIANNIDVNALPKNHKLTQGEASISQNNNAMTIDQKSDRVSIDWESFNIGKQASVTFNQPASSSIAYNRVTGADVSTIQGKLNANGRVFLSNPNGVIFTKDAQVNVGAILATTKEVEKLADKPMRSYARDEANFKRKTDKEGEIRNEGVIQAEEAIYLVANKVVNNGKLHLTGNPEEVIKLNYSGNLDGIAVKNKTVLLAAGDSFTFDLANFSISLTGKQVAGLIENKGAIISNDRILLTAKGEDQLKHSAVNNAGLLEANDIAIEGGKIVLTEQSDIRYGKDSRNGATLKITQTGKDKDASIKIGGKITALAQTDNVKQATYHHNDRFQSGKMARDEQGKILYTVDKKTIAKAEQSENGLIGDDGKLYTNQSDVVFVISARNGGYQTDRRGYSPEFNQKFEALRLPYRDERILEISYNEKNGELSDIKIIKRNNNLDSINSKIADILEEKIKAKDFSFLKKNELDSLTAKVIEEQKQELINKLGINDQQLSLLSGDQTVKVEERVYTAPAVYLLKSNVTQILEEVKKSKPDAKFEDLTLLASILNNRRPVSQGIDNSKTKTGFLNDEKKQIYPLMVSQSVSEKLKQNIALPLTTISTQTQLEIQNAEFNHIEGGKHNVMILANNAKDNEATIRLQRSHINLGGGSFGIGSTTGFVPLQENILQVKQENGQLISLYNVTGTSLKQKTLNELLKNIKFYKEFESKFPTKDNQQISLPELWRQFVENPTIQNKNVENVNFYTFVKENFKAFVQDKLEKLPSQVETVLSRSTFSDGSTINSSWKKIEVAKQATNIPGLTAHQYAPFNVELNEVTFQKSKDFIIADGFKTVQLNKVTSKDEIGIYINAGNQRSYFSKETNLSENVKKQGYEYLIANLEERITRGNFSVLNERYDFNQYNWDVNNTPFTRKLAHSERASRAANRELNRAFAEWVGDATSQRSHIDGTKITIRDSQLNSKDGFMHLLAKDVDIQNSRLTVNYARPLYDDFMPKASKIGINAKNIRLDHSHLFVSGEDRLNTSAMLGAAGIFLIGDVVGKNSSIYAKTYQGYSIRTSGKTTLSGESSAKDLRITVIHTGPYPKDSGSVFGANSADYFIEGIGFDVGDIIQRDEKGNVISGTTLSNLEFNIFAPNGARAFKSYGNSSKDYVPNIKVMKNAIFNYFERPRIVSLASNVVTGKSQALSLRDMLRNIDQIQGVKASNLGLQQASNTNLPTSLNQIDNIIQNVSLPEERSEVETCDASSQECSTLPSKMNGKVSVGEIL
ncbi:filamentous hemagglutinin N-terminal domain-containing protein [Avibacterium paragallinarum]|uniref:two-partner secretion domain-containing protein n=1 Tax=Avibacterium paragallinarum TaxID=728 RepID=UPI000614DF76|nr:filamentous hemagglutinin N-terminal domain-containing protein [Avibacterium paragallinarum]KAA6210113.1 filamentous hemagglutinin N-terminal domain-containing protein [Avibacterium paragallinarum]KKB02294.1 hemagglutination protein [Avibacterium paragallinarum]RZN74272.1 filamentous hemagglutinin N-terminal domain-containing protein [Avibacterium paragallinarum]